jgi:quercetin dioxygenase-like cupin family protein
MTKNNPATADSSVPVEYHNIELALPPAVNRRRWVWGLAAAPLIAALAFAQVEPLQIIGLAQGSNPDHNVVLHIKGPTDVLTADLIFQPGAGTGWHIHPGPVVVTVKKGALTEIHSNGCTTVHPEGSAFFEKADEVHNAVNQTGTATEVYATFLSPAGAPPLISVTDPGTTCRN